MIARTLAVMHAVSRDGADFRFATASPRQPQGPPVLVELADHALNEQERLIRDARQAGAEAAGEAALLVFLGDLALDFLPIDAERRVGQAVAERLAGVPILGEGLAEGDPARVLALDLVRHRPSADPPWMKLAQRRHLSFFIAGRTCRCVAFQAQRLPKGHQPVGGFGSRRCSSATEGMPPVPQVGSP